MSLSKRFRGPAGAVLAAAAAVVLAAPPAAAFTPAAPTAPPPPPTASVDAQAASPLAGDEGRYLVRFAKGSDVATEAQSLQGQGVRIGRTFSAAVRGAAVTATKAQAAALARSPRVALIEPDLPVTVADTQQAPPWGLDRIDQRALPLSGTFTPMASGAGVSTYVIDTGVLAENADFGGRVAPGWTAIADGRGSSDCNGHGTHVAGIIAGKTYGVAKAATVVPVRALGCDGSGFDSDVIAGLDWIASQHAAGTPAVANLSIGGPTSTTLDDAIRGIINDGVTAVVAAGNAAVDACTTSPARVPEALTVAASDSSDRQAGFSNYGSCVDMYAPGVNIQSDWDTSTTSLATLSGTSMASPHVAGAAALSLSRNPQQTPAAVAADLTAAATQGTVSNVSAGTPNRLLFTGPTLGPVPAPVARDFTSDGKADLLAQDGNGSLWTYPGQGNGLFGWRIKVGDGWNVMTAVSAAGDLTGDGKPDLVARDTTGALWTYPGLGNGLFGWRIKVGDGWNVMTSISAAGDLTGDGKPDLIARDTDGTLWTYPGLGNGLFGWRIKVGDGWNVMTSISAAG
ncbi:S8 family serine peptidase, partial [Pseudarthrobacter sp. NPDC058119]|uniref:S8 family serine peptidase n=1 Tax=Pseudarthrobacter sp. NPDC058119 TaxID=3346348 RepID=UPI0036DE5D98